MQPGDTVNFTIFRQTAAGASSTGKVLADFTVQGYKDGAEESMTVNITEIGTTGSLCAYALSVELPIDGPYQFALAIQAATGTDIVTPQFLSGEIEQQDQDSTYDVVARPTASLSDATVFSSEVQLDMIAYRETPISLNIVNQAGAAVNLTTYDNWRFSVWDKTHSGSILYTDPANFTGSSGGVVTGLIPEDAAFFSEIADAFAASEDFVTLYYDIIADAASDSSKTRTIARGKLILYRYEGAA